MSAKSLHRRWKHEIQIAVLRRRPARILQREQSSPQAPSTELCTNEVMSPLSTVGPATTARLCSHQVSNRLVPSPFGEVCFWLAMALPGDFANQFLSLVALCHPSTLSSKRHGMLSMELETYRRCFPVQPALSALQRFHGRKYAFFLRDLTAAADLPPHGALFSQQLLDLTHRWWTEGEDTDIDIK